MIESSLDLTETSFILQTFKRVVRFIKTNCQQSRKGAWSRVQMEA